MNFQVQSQNLLNHSNISLNQQPINQNSGLFNANQIQNIDKSDQHRNNLTLPTNFSVIYKNNNGAKLSASGTFHDQDNKDQIIDSLGNLQVKKIICFESSAIVLEYDAILASNQYKDTMEIINVIDGECVAVEDYTSPTMNQLKVVVNKIDAELNAGNSLHLHCWGGTGRTAVFLAAWMMKKYNITPDEAVDKLRKEYHASSVEIPSQKQLLDDYYKELNPQTNYQGSQFYCHHQDQPKTVNFLQNVTHISEDAVVVLKSDISKMQDKLQDIMGYLQNEQQDMASNCFSFKSPSKITAKLDAIKLQSDKLTKINSKVMKDNLLKTIDTVKSIHDNNIQILSKNTKSIAVHSSKNNTGSLLIYMTDLELSLIK